MTIKEIFKELDKRVGKDLIVSYSEVRIMSKLSNQRFNKIFHKWEQCEACLREFEEQLNNPLPEWGFPPDGSYEEALLGIL